jgi:hypothetical protein
VFQKVFFKFELILKDVAFLKLGFTPQGHVEILTTLNGQ